MRLKRRMGLEDKWAAPRLHDGAMTLAGYSRVMLESRHDRFRWLPSQRRHRAAERARAGVLGATCATRRLAVRAWRHEHGRDSGRGNVSVVVRGNGPARRTSGGARHHARLVALPPAASLSAPRRTSALHRPETGVVSAAPAR